MARAALALLAAAALTFSAGGQAAKYLGLAALAPLFLAYFIAAFRLDLAAEALRGARGVWAAGGIVAAYALAFVLLFPMADAGAFGPGSDRNEALDLAANALMEGRPLYAETTYLGNEATPLPGAVLLAAPFTALGGAAWQNLLWLPVLAGLALALLGRGAGAAYLLLFVALNPGFAQDFLTGGDYAVNSVYVMAALTLAVRLSATPFGAVAGGVLVGLAVASRPLHLLAALVALGAARWRAAFAAACLGAAALVTLPFWAQDPEGFAPLHVARYVQMSPLAGAVSTAAALAVAAAAFRLRPLATRAAIGLYGLSLAVALVPPALIWSPTITSRMWDLTVPAALAGGLWLAGRLAAPGGLPDRDGSG